MIRAPTRGPGPAVGLFDGFPTRKSRSTFAMTTTGMKSMQRGSNVTLFLAALTVAAVVDFMPGVSYARNAAPIPPPGGGGGKVRGGGRGKPRPPSKPTPHGPDGRGKRGPNPGEK